MNKYFLLLFTFIFISFNIFNYVQAQEIESKTMEKENSTPKFLYKIISPEQWQESLRKNQVVTSPIDKDFIHLAKEEQVNQVVQKFWNHMDHVILKLDTTRLKGRLIYETNPGGTTKYYHLYEGNIPLEAVVDASVIHG